MYRLALLLFSTVLILSSCVPANLPSEAGLRTGQAALWRSTWHVEAARSRVLDVSLVPVLTGLERPVAIVDPEDGSAGFLIAEQGGRVVWARPNVPEHQLVLDLTDEISCCGERGLIGLTVHPDFRNDPRIYVHYTDAENDTVVAEYTGRPGEVDPASARILLRVEQPDVTHNGGQLAFGPDGLLYVALGDGGFGVSPRWTAQDPDSRLGKVLRLHPDAPDAVETVALGLRNP